MASQRSEKPIRASLRSVSQQSPQGCPQNSGNVWLNTDRSRPWRVECRPLSFSTPLSFRRSMLCCSGLSVFRKFLNASEHLWPAKLTRCDICCTCQSICPFIPTDSGVSRTVGPQKSMRPETAWLCASMGCPFQTPSFAGGSLSLWESWHV